MSFKSNSNAALALWARVVILYNAAVGLLVLWHMLKPEPFLPQAASAPLVVLAFLVPWVILQALLWGVRRDYPLAAEALTLWLPILALALVASLWDSRDAGLSLVSIAVSWLLGLGPSLFVCSLYWRHQRRRSDRDET